MKRQELESVLDAILNRADFRDLDVLKVALERRARDLNRVGGPGLDLAGNASRMAESIQAQIGGTRAELDTMVRNLVEGLIRQKAPDIPEEHLKALLSEWAPDAQARAERSQKAPVESTNLPADLLTVMIREFVAYSTGAMTAGEQVRLNDEIPDWPTVYWKKFPDRIQRLIKVFLDGKLPLEDFWNEVRQTLRP
jgi:hypothetical protein